jgi:hypothetical protein
MRHDCGERARLLLLLRRMVHVRDFAVERTRWVQIRWLFGGMCRLGLVGRRAVGRRLGVASWLGCRGRVEVDDSLDGLCLLTQSLIIHRVMNYLTKINPQVNNLS